ncbi:MAG: ABC transporter permease [Proteobacteria bacterium]|nr:ABC transporter permease [Pseudomonadota bacterium]
MKFKQYIAIIAFKTKAELKAESQRTYLGFLWWLFEPLMYLGIFYVVFTNLRQTNIENFIQFLLVGLVFWKWFSASITQSSSAIMFQINLLRQIKISAWVFPIIKVSVGTFKFFIIFILLLVLLWSTGFLPSLNYFYLIEIIALQYLLISGVVLTLSAIVPFIPDIRYIVDNLMIGMFFLSGIFFSIDSVPANFRDILYINPMLHLIENARLILINDQAPKQLHLLYVFGVALFFIIIGLLLFKKFQHNYAKLSES